MKIISRIAAAPLCLALASAAHAQNSSAVAGLAIYAVASSPAALTWLEAGSYSSRSASSAAFAGWAPTGFGEFAPTFNTAVANSSTTPGLWRGTSFANAGDGAVSTSVQTYHPDTFSPSVPYAQLGALTTMSWGGYGVGDAFVRSYFSLAAGASVSFTSELLLSVTGTNPAFTPDHITTDLYSAATGLMAIDGVPEDSRTMGNAALPYTAGPYAFNQVTSFSVSITNSTAADMTGFLDAGLSVYAVSAVPEPGTYALLLAGLACTGLVAHRRRRG